MRRWIRIAGFTVLISLILLLSSCGALKPLLTEEEVFSSLSERYGTDFVILKTINNCEYRTEDETIRCRLYWLLRPRIRNVLFGCIRRSVNVGEAILFLDENDNIVYRDNVETLLSDIDKTIYGIGEE